MSSRRGNQQARLHSEVNKLSWVQNWILSILPIKAFKANREALVETYAHFAVEIDEARDWMDSRSDEEIRREAREAGYKAPDHDPHPINTKIAGIFGRVTKFLNPITYLFIVVGTLGSIGQLVAVGMHLQRLPGTV